MNEENGGGTPVRRPEFPRATVSKLSDPRCWRGGRERTLQAMRSYTHEDFDRLTFHDNLLRGVAIRCDLGRSDLVLDIDYIDEWITPCTKPSWKVASADLTFHGVTGLDLSMNWDDAKYHTSRAGEWILGLTREPVAEQLVYLDRPYYVWRFSFALHSRLSFGAYGFTLKLRQEPIEWEEQSLPLHLRAE
jgi:hypothetical protein